MEGNESETSISTAVSFMEYATEMGAKLTINGVAYAIQPNQFTTTGRSVHLMYCSTFITLSTQSFTGSKSYG